MMMMREAGLTGLNDRHTFARCDTKSEQIAAAPNLTIWHIIVLDSDRDKALCGFNAMLHSGWESFGTGVVFESRICPTCYKLHFKKEKESV